MLMFVHAARRTTSKTTTDSVTDVFTVSLARKVFMCIVLCWWESQVSAMHTDATKSRLRSLWKPVGVSG